MYPYNLGGPFFGYAPVQSTVTGAASTTSYIPWASPSSSSTWSFDPTATSKAEAPICGAGFTYCGYILRDHQNFKEEDIIATFCAARPDNCVNGKPKSDPYQALYVCVPPAANPQDTSTPNKNKYPYKSIKAPRSTLTDNAENQELNEESLLSSPETEKVIAPRNHHDHIKAHSNPDTTTNTDKLDLEPAYSHSQPTLQKLLNLRWLRPPHPWPQALAATTTGISLPSVPATTTTHPTSTPSSSPAGGGSGSGSSNSCSAGAGAGVAVPGNRIELLCSCSGGQCVNPAADHIGRCETPCL